MKVMIRKDGRYYWLHQRPIRRDLFSPDAFKHPDEAREDFDLVCRELGGKVARKWIAGLSLIILAQALYIVVTL